uniref:LYR motif containing 4 n=1 Tax=Sus scrofa TaxID=9823 RepID=A0A4X1SL25_PIG
MAASSRAQVLDLYRAMLRESKHFSAYNYRTYAIRRIRDAFRENKNVGDPAEIQALVTKAKRNLGIIRRQVSCAVLCSRSRGALRVVTSPWSGRPGVWWITTPPWSCSCGQRKLARRAAESGARKGKSRSPEGPGCWSFCGARLPG